MAATEVLAGRKVLLVEDDFFVADEIVRTLAEGGADVVGPAVSVQGALELIDRSAPLDGAVLDVNLNGEKVYPVADALAERGVPFVFATSCSKEMIPRRYAAVTSCGSRRSAQDCSSTVLMTARRPPWFHCRTTARPSEAGTGEPTTRAAAGGMRRAERGQPKRPDRFARQKKAPVGGHPRWGGTGAAPAVNL